MNSKAVNFSFLLGALILVFVFAILLASAISFLLGFSLTFWPLILGLCSGLIFLHLAAGRYFVEKRFKIVFGLILSFTIILFISIFISSQFYDVSVDGQYYHQEAIIQLAEGWNPVYEQITPLDDLGNIQINSFPKASEIWAASLYKITGHIEQGKAFNFLLIAAAFFISCSALSNFKKISPDISFLLSFLLAFNPVSTYQSLSYYVDGQLASVLVILVSLSALLIMEDNFFILLAAALALVILLNIKLSGFFYAAMFIGSFLIMMLLCKKRRLFFKTLLVMLVGFAVGFLVVGFNPYGTNMIRHANPFFPLGQINYGSVNHPYLKAKILDHQFNFSELNRFEKLLFSLFSKPSHRIAEIKLPLTISVSKLGGFTAPNIPLGGFGPLFSDCFVLSFLIIVLGLKTNFSQTKIAVGAVFLILLSAFLNPEAWWARYAPQLFLIPAVAIVLGLHSSGKISEYLSYFLISFLLLNFIFISSSYFSGQYQLSNLLRQQLKELSASSSKQIFVKFSTLSRSNRVRLAEAGISFEEISTPQKYPEEQGINLIGSSTRFFLKY